MAFGFDLSGFKNISTYNQDLDEKKKSIAATPGMTPDKLMENPFFKRTITTKTPTPAYTSPVVTGEPGTEDRLKSTQSAYNKLLEQGPPQAIWGAKKDGPESPSLFGTGDAYKSEVGQDVLANIASGVRGEDPSLKALAKQQGLAQLMLNRRANAMRGNTAAQLAQAGQLGQAVGANAMSGVERQIAQQATQQMLEQDAARLDAEAKTKQFWTDTALGQMATEKSSADANRKGFMELYAGLAKESPSALKTLTRTLEEDLGLQAPQNAADIDRWKTDLARLDPNSELQNAAVMKLFRETLNATPGTGKTQITPGDVAFVEGGFDNDVAQNIIKNPSSVLAGPDDSWNGYEQISRAPTSMPKAGDGITIGGRPYVVVEVGGSKTDSSDKNSANRGSYALVRVKDATGDTKSVWIREPSGSQAGAAPAATSSNLPAPTQTIGIAGLGAQNDGTGFQYINAQLPGLPKQGDRLVIGGQSFVVWGDPESVQTARDGTRYIPFSVKGPDGKLKTFAIPPPGANP